MVGRRDDRAVVSVERTGRRPRAPRWMRTIGGGGVAVFPADTLYGLACDPLQRRRRSSASMRSRAATTASPRPSSTSRRSRCASSSRAWARAPATRSAPCCPGPVTLVVANPERRYPLACREDPERLGVRLIVDPPLGGADAPPVPDERQPQRRACAGALRRGRRPRSSPEPTSRSTGASSAACRRRSSTSRRSSRAGTGSCCARGRCQRTRSIRPLSSERPRGVGDRPHEQLAGLLQLGPRLALDPLEGHPLDAGHDQQRHGGDVAGPGAVGGRPEALVQDLAPDAVDLLDRLADIRVDDRDGGEVEVERAGCAGPRSAISSIATATPRVRSSTVSPSPRSLRGRGS